jgi:ATP-dependent helicase YprA (DUF1998 family)
MNPIKLSRQLQDTLVSYLTTTFDVNRDGQEPALAAFIKKSLNEPRSLFAGPYLELTPPYKTAETLEQLAEAGVISPKLLQMQCFRQGRPLPIGAPLYTHQAAAIRKLCAEKRNLVVSSGTGSGKTECFLIPILNDLLIDPEPGVRAVLVYPLNALVNDQLDRLRVLLRGTGITFGRYTSELEQKSEQARRQMEKEWRDMDPAQRALFDQYPLPNEIIGRDQIQEQGMLPQILITNYAMLEYLLLRPQDNPLFIQGRWRFIVLDEAHTYAGAQGIEVGLLMRRLKLRLGAEPGKTRCIATSATLTNDDAGNACQFAEALFGEEFATDDIVFGELDHDYVPPTTSRQPVASAYVHEEFENLIRNVRQEHWESADEIALLMNEIGLIDSSELGFADQHSTPQFLWEVLRGNADLTNLRNLMAKAGQPIEVETVAEQLFHDRLPPEQQQDALYHLIELASMARPEVDKPSLLPARYHLFVRPPQGIWVCLNPACAAKHSENEWSKLFATPRETCDVCQAPVYPLFVCRACGQVYVRLQKDGKEYLPDAAPQVKPQANYVTWRPIHENLALADEEVEEDDEESLVGGSDESILKQVELKLCMVCRQAVNAKGRCGCDSASEQIATLYRMTEESQGKRGKNDGTQQTPVHSLHECGRCHSRALKGTEIATDITMDGRSPLAILTRNLYRELPESSQSEIQGKAGGGRKLISFYDSRQGAAQFAAFMQDVVNQQAYRRIVIEAVKNSASASFWPDTEKVSEECLSLALSYRVINNDLGIVESPLPTNPRNLNQSERDRLMRHMRKHLFAEITTELRTRLALETIGLLSVQYYESDRMPDFDSLGVAIGLSAAEARTLVEYLLDELRRGKVVTLPEGVHRDDPIFGRNKFSHRLVRHDAGTNEVAWIGKTTRQRRRLLVAKVLRSKGLSADDEHVARVLGTILDWLIEQTDILDVSRPADGYQIRHDRLFFCTDARWCRCDQCQRLSSRGDALPCQHVHCRGTLRPIKKLDSDNFHYKDLQQELVPLRVEEHTAQLDPGKGRDYQNKFKSGEINMLSCSTTFELGIDLGDLQAVVMNNIPPTVANYKQRAGRAGRRAGGTAFILAWASNRPHDQTYFRTPAEIIGGQVRVPFVDIQNPIVIQRHVNAIVLSEFLRHCAAQAGKYDKSTGAFFDAQTPEGAYYQMMPQWIDEQQSLLLFLLGKYSDAIHNTIDPGKSVELYVSHVREKGYEHYQKIADYYKGIRRELLQQLDAAMDGSSSSSDEGSILADIKRFKRLLDRLRDEDTINYLSDRGVLPSYSFPLHVVELRLPFFREESKDLRLQRSLEMAIREYAPGQEIVADKRIWKSEGLDFFGKEPQVFAYHICPNCNHLRLVDTPGKALDPIDQPCPVCQEEPPRGKWTQYQYIQPDGFRASNGSGQPAGQYVDRQLNLMRSALVPRQIDTHPVSQVLALGYDRAGALLYVNEGLNGGGFKICPTCGKQLRGNKCDGRLNGKPCTGVMPRDAKYALGFKQDTDTLHMRFSSTPHIVLPEPDNLSFWLSLTYAILQGASRALQIERRDIEGLLFPEPAGAKWRQSIVLYDKVPGGAGHVKRIHHEINKVIAAAIEIVSCNCEKSCYRCLREYGNQSEHHLLDRSPVLAFLRALDADLQQTLHGESDGMHPVAAVNQSAWLWETIERSQQEVMLSVDSMSVEGPNADGATWFDLLQQLLIRHVKVRLYLRELPDQADMSGTGVLMAAHLRLLMRRGLDLRQTSRSLPWLAVIDPATPMSTAVKQSNGSLFVLNGEATHQLNMTTRSSDVIKAWNALKDYNGRVVELAELREPGGTMVVEVRPDGRTHSEAEYFSSFYAEPVRGMEVSDRYLDDRDRIIRRLGAHIELAHQQGALQWITVKTKQGGHDQQQAISYLKSLYPSVRIKFDNESHTVHDRFIKVTRANGRQSRVIIGKGLDFIQPNGEVNHTFLVFQEI